MKPAEIPLERGKYYHIYNRGSNRRKLFYNEENYKYFLRKYDYYLSGWVDTYAYCLLPNHFHLLVRVKEEFAKFSIAESNKFPPEQLLKVPLEQALTVPPFKKVELAPDIKVELAPDIKVELVPDTKVEPRHQPTPDKLISEQFRKLFTGYAMAINKQQKRAGRLFQKNFKRIQITSDDYLVNLVYYIHANPQKHGYVKDFRFYKWSSFDNIVKNNTDKDITSELFDWYGDRADFIRYHHDLDLPELVNEFVSEY